MCIYGGHVCICIPNMKFLCLTVCQREVCTDDANTDPDTGWQWCTMDKAWLYKALWLINQMSQKNLKTNLLYSLVGTNYTQSIQNLGIGARDWNTMMFDTNDMRPNIAFYHQRTFQIQWHCTHKYHQKETHKQTNNAKAQH